MGGKKRILTNDQIEKKIHRICYEIHEAAYQEKEIVLFGIANKGYRLAEILVEKLKEIFPGEILLKKITVHTSERSVPEVELSFTDLEHKTVFIIDDVLNTGFTLVYALKEVLNYRVKRINTIVLVDRKHRKFPVRANIVGLTLSTTLEDHIQVEISKDNQINAYLV